MRSLKKRLQREEGQSVTELALMMPVIFIMFFWAIQAQIILSGMHQTAYASYAAARTLTVKHKGAKSPQQTMKRILTGKIFTESEKGPASLSETQRNPGSLWGTTDGVSIKLPQFASLPYARGTAATPMLNFDLNIPAHLGPDEWDNKILQEGAGNQYTDDTGASCIDTDNNLRDSGGC